MTFPRRIQMQKWIPAERAIHDAIQAVENVGADLLLTDAVILLGKAKDKVADYVDRNAAANASPSEPPVGKDSSFEGLSELLDALIQAVREESEAFEDSGEDSLVSSTMAEVVNDALSAIESLFAKQRERAEYLRREWKMSIETVASLQSELERQRETTLTPAEALMIDDTLNGLNGRVWAQVVAKLRRIAASSPKQSAPEGR